MTTADPAPRRRPAVPLSTVKALDDALAILRESGYGEDASAIERRLVGMASQPTTIVVVGELSRGKSSVVNAMIGVPGLAPVGDHETTAIPVAFSPPRDELAEGAVRLTFADEVRFVAADELREWVTAGGAKANSDEAATLRAVEVGVESSWFPGVTIVDTPGSGGLSELHARRALQTAERAGILLVVTDAGGRITSDALRFLHKAASFAGHVIVVVNKIDQNRQWRRVLEENQSIVRQDGGIAAATFVGVSALSAERALRSPAEADDWWSISGFPVLRELLARPLARADRLPDMAALQQVRASLRKVVDDLNADLMAEQGTDEAVAALSARQGEYEELLDNGNGWRYRLNRAIRDVQGPIRRDALAYIERFHAEWQAKINKGIFGLSNSQIAVHREQMRVEVENFEYEVRASLVAGAVNAVRELFDSAGLRPPPELAGIEFSDVTHGDEASASQAGNALQLLSIAMLSTSPARSFGVFGIPIAAVGLVGALFVAKRLKNRAEAQQALLTLVRGLRERIQTFLSDSSSHLSLDVAEVFESELRQRSKTLARQVETAKQARSTAENVRRVAQKRIHDQTTRVRSADAAAAEELRRLSGSLSPGRGT